MIVLDRHYRDEAEAAADEADAWDAVTTPRNTGVEDDPTLSLTAAAYALWITSAATTCVTVTAFVMFGTVPALLTLAGGFMIMGALVWWAI